jgi:hypothetical protein
VLGTPLARSWRSGLVVDLPAQALDIHPLQIARDVLPDGVEAVTAVLQPWYTTRYSADTSPVRSAPCWQWISTGPSRSTSRKALSAVTMSSSRMFQVLIGIRCMVIPLPARISLSEWNARKLMTFLMPSFCNCGTSSLESCALR